MFYLAYCSLPSGIPSTTEVKIETNAAMQAVDSAVIQFTSCNNAVVPIPANKPWQNVLNALAAIALMSGFLIKLSNIFFPRFLVDP